MAEQSLNTEKRRQDYISRLLIQSTPDNSNLWGKSKKVRVIGGSKKIAGSKGKKTVFTAQWALERLSDNWKILLDYKSDCNVTKRCLNRACQLLFWEVNSGVMLFQVRFVTTSASTSKLYACNTSMGNSKFTECFGRQYTVFVQLYMVRVIESKII